MGLVAQGQVLSPSGGNGSKYWGRVSGKSVRAPAMPWSRCQTQQGPRGVASGLPPSGLRLGKREAAGYRLLKRVWLQLGKRLEGGVYETIAAAFRVEGYGWSVITIWICGISPVRAQACTPDPLSVLLPKHSVWYRTEVLTRKPQDRISGDTHLLRCLGLDRLPEAGQLETDGT
eukprot:CAMPEP_0174366260 /NCGR_PEP_ID=MMETSP0811_2-20130205/80545_1 /TAXON_ID=73025 ORGANISM="Eutreptiella gymnastica-like, Strain CCMP1594" /NCGR_SAMPLE_ID=MMETSP0811_2 /ASSEMBLY_ACC=CAM_ASM_000667 /LENGTH=173 /DNA_ID=CAMNT_0015507673 /DNA_START=300 /DNA_END=822 /DNA_ORIENTATION=-